MADLVRGRYHVINPLLALVGGASNANQANITPRSNIEFPGTGALTDGSALTTAVMTVVAVPVETGDVLSKVTVAVGATAAGTPVNQWAALYSSSGALLAQSTDGGSGAIAASGAFTFTLSTPVEVSTGPNGNAANGFLYAAIMVKATTPPTLASFGVGSGVNYKWFANGPQLSGTAGSALTATAPATLPSVTGISIAPVVFLQ